MAAVASSLVRSQRAMLPVPTRVTAFGTAAAIIGTGARATTVGERGPWLSWQVVVASRVAASDSGASSLERGRVMKGLLGIDMDPCTWRAVACTQQRFTL